MKPFYLLLFSASMFIFSCFGGGGGSNDNTSSTAPSSFTMTEADYDQLSPEEKYSVISKLTSTLYKGIPVKEFFDVKKSNFDLTIQSATQTKNHLKDIKEALTKPISNEKLDFYIQTVESKYDFDKNKKQPQYIMALLYELPISKTYYDMWMAYFLSNTVLFSPATELESTDYIDIQRVFQRLYNSISQDKPIREIVYNHMISQENWRRFRSPEDNTREMMEIFLRRFKDEEVPKASIACKNWYLTDDTGGYQLVIELDENYEPQNILETTVVNCYDFYRAISEHKDLIPTVVSVIVDHLFSTYSDEQKKGIVNTVLSQNPKTFRDVFNLLIFSKEYLLKVERPKKWEEAFLGTGYRIYFKPSKNFFKYINRDRTSYRPFTSLYDMKQPPFAEKLGRSPIPPLDALSFAYYHKGLREQLMIDRVTDEFNENDFGWREEFIDVPFAEDDFIHYVFVSVLGRKATEKELSVLNQVFEKTNLKDSDKWKKTMIILDYISRLTEFYSFRSIGGEK